MKLFLIIAAVVLASTLTAQAQGFFGPSSGADVRFTYPRAPSYRAINHDPATGRTYARDADYLPVKPVKRIKQRQK